MKQPACVVTNHLRANMDRVKAPRNRQNHAHLDDAQMLLTQQGSYALSQVDFDLAAWPVVSRVSDDVTVLQKGDITWQFGMDSTDETARPLSLTFEEGDGAVVYTSWRMASNTANTPAAFSS